MGVTKYQWQLKMRPRVREKAGSKEAWKDMEEGTEREGNNMITSFKKY